MATIPLLIKRLQEASCVKDAFRSYTGTDWKQHVTYLYGAKCCYPTTIWKQKNMELVIMGWHDQQEYRYYTNHSAVHTHVLEGELTSSVQPMDKKPASRLLLTGSFCTIPPLSVWQVSSLKTSTSLHLFHTSHMN